MGFRMLSSLRTQLIALTIVIQIITVAALVWNSMRLTETHLARLLEQRRAETSLLLEAAVAPAMVQRDYAAASETLISAQQLQGLAYLAVFDENEQLIATAGSVTHPSEVMALRVPIRMEGRVYGTLLVNIDLAFMQAARQEILLQNLALALSGLLLSSLALGAVALWLTRRLGMLSQASHDLAAGLPFRPLPEQGRDDIARVIQAFNGMAQTLERRVSDLRDAESRQRALLSAVDAERSRLDALLSAMRLGLVFADENAQICYLNPAFAAVWGINLDGHIATLPLHDLRNWLSPQIAGPAQTMLFAGEGALSELPLRDGRIITQHAVPVAGMGEEQLGHLWIFEDITHERQVAERLVFMAERDALTGLFNRTRFQEELERLVSSMVRHPDHQGAILYFDLDEFKTINDTFGHRAGDNVLVRAANAISQMIRNDEVFARLGGDEFAIIVPNTHASGAEIMADRVIQGLRALSFEFDGERFGLTCSVGIALLPEHGQSVEELVARADAAMYQAKRAGKNCWRVYRPELDESAHMLTQLGWNEKIQAALDEDRLVLHFQGIHAVDTRSICHYEALVRMVDPEGNLLLPGNFIPAAERTGRIVDIDRWVIRAAIRKLAEQPALPPIAINVSARSFDDPDLSRTIRSTLEEFAVTPARLMIELTETAALANIRDSESFIRDLRQLGCTVCLDDFGVGFSSFAYLKHLSANVLKIDGMFVRNLANSHEDQVFVRAIVEVARGLGKKTVAEFVGDAATLALVAELGVDYAQGYFLSFPIAEIS